MLGHIEYTMKKTLLILAPLSMLALAACNKSQPAADASATAPAADVAAAAAPAGPAITSSATYHCGDSSVIYVDYFGTDAADIHAGDKAAVAVHVAADAAKPGTPMKSADGKSMLSGDATKVNVKLADKGAQTCKA